MKLKNMLYATKRSASVACKWLRKYSPEIMTTAGILTFVGAGILAVRNTIKNHDAVAMELMHVSNANELIEENKELPEEDLKDIKDAKKKAIAKVAVLSVKSYAVPVAMAATASALMIFSTRILRTRCNKLVAAYAAINASFQKYRKRVANEVGEEKEREIRYGVVNTSDENKKILMVPLDIQDVESNAAFERYFDNQSCHWINDPTLNEMFFKQVEKNLNSKCFRNLSVSVNDLYELLGLEKIPKNALIGDLFGRKYDKENPVKLSYMRLENIDGECRFIVEMEDVESLV